MAAEAAASLGFSCETDDHTYELILYRRPGRCGTPRAVDPASVKEMEHQTFPHTFNSYDHESERVLITPTGPDPVRAGEAVEADAPAFDHIETEEKPSPVPSASRISDNAAATNAPPITAAQDTPDARASLGISGSVSLWQRVSDGRGIVCSI